MFLWKALLDSTDKHPVPPRRIQSLEQVEPCDCIVLSPWEDKSKIFWSGIWECQAPLSMGFSRQEYWSGLPFPSPGDLLDPGIKPRSPVSPALADGFVTTSTTWKAHVPLVATVQLDSLGLEDRGWVMVEKITSFFSSFRISSSLLSPFLAPAIQPPLHSTLRLSLLYAMFFGRKRWGL